jgi:hypothetical protein
MGEQRHARPDLHQLSPGKGPQLGGRASAQRGVSLDGERALRPLDKAAALSATANKECGLGHSIDDAIDADRRPDDSPETSSVASKLA